MAEKNGFFGVYFKTFANDIDEDQVRQDFGKYGRIIFLKTLPPRVYINFGSKEEAERCLLDAVDPKYGEIKQGRFGEEQNSREQQNSNWRFDTCTKKADKLETTQRNSVISSLVSESGVMHVRNTETGLLDESHCRGNELLGSRSPRSTKAVSSDKICPSNLRDVNEHRVNSDSQCYVSNKTSRSRESERYNSNGPPPLLSIDDSPPPLLSIKDRPPPLLSIYDGLPPLLSSKDQPPPFLANDHPPRLLSINDDPPLLSVSVNDSPPPLISALETKLSTPTRAYHTPRKALLPTPPLEMRIDFNSRSLDSQSTLSGHDIPPPLVSAISNPNGFQSSRKSYSCTPYEGYTQKYGNYILIVNVPKNISADEVEKVLYPHIPIDVSGPESTNIKMKVLFCVVTFNTRDEATKAAKQLDGVELRGQCLRMITLDELIVFSEVPF